MFAPAEVLIPHLSPGKFVNILEIWIIRFRIDPMIVLKHSLTRRWLLGYALALILGISLGGCRSAAISSQPPSPETAPAPSRTTSPPLEPTSSPRPTVTPNPTDTPAVTATQASSQTPTQGNRATVAASRARSRIKDDLAQLDLRAGNGHLEWFQARPTSIDLDQYNQVDGTQFRGDPSAGDFILKSDITWESSGGPVTCGFIFRSEPDLEGCAQYQFRMQGLSGQPSWAISFYQYGAFAADVSGTRASGAILTEQGSTNSVILFAEGEKFTLYINDQRIGSFYDFSQRRTEGFFAFLAQQETGESSCTFDNAWIWALE
jgi:hypothetical protein